MSRKTVIAGLLAAAVVACTSVQVERPLSNTVRIVCRTDWSGMKSAQPDTFGIAVTRTVHAIHRYWEKVAVRPEPDTLQLPTGAYLGVLFGCEDPDAYRFEHMREFAADSLTSMRTLTARLLPSPDNTTCRTIGRQYKGLMASAMDTLPNATDLFVARIQENLSPREALYEFTFKPQPLLQDIRISVRLETPEDTPINEVWGCITGVAQEVEIMSGYLNTHYTGQTMFPMENTSGNVWEGSLRTLGIKAPADTSMRSGPGMLRLGVDVGIKNRKIVKVVNLHNLLRDNPSLTTTDVEGVFSGGARSLTYAIPTPLRLTGSTEPGEQGGEDPVSPWLDPEDGDTHDILDGDDEDHD